MARENPNAGKNPFSESNGFHFFLQHVFFFTYVQVEFWQCSVSAGFSRFWMCNFP